MNTIIQEEDINLFRYRRCLTVLAKNFLVILDDLRAEHDTRIDETGASLIEFEDFLLDNHGIKVQLSHLGKHFQFFDEDKAQRLRKKVLDLSNNLQREISK